jgi:hypothetical protein
MVLKTHHASQNVATLLVRLSSIEGRDKTLRMAFFTHPTQRGTERFWFEIACCFAKV